MYAIRSYYAQDNGTAVCLKHFALNNQENNRGTVDVIVGERAMREIYLSPFKAAVQDVITSYSIHYTKLYEAKSSLLLQENPKC